MAHTSYARTVASGSEGESKSSVGTKRQRKSPRKQDNLEMAGASGSESSVGTTRQRKSPRKQENPEMAGASGSESSVARTKRQQ